MAGPATANPPLSTPEGGADQPFDTALRGYERRQVDDFVAARSKEISRLKSQLADERRQRQAATERADAAATELREVRARSAHEPADPQESFGFRAEKLLRMAEQEAVEIRSNASRESSSIIEQARKEAEQHRHEVEQTLISRASLLEQQAAQRSVRDPGARAAGGRPAGGRARAGRPDARRGVARGRAAAAGVRGGGRGDPGPRRGRRAAPARQRRRRRSPGSPRCSRTSAPSWRASPRCSPTSWRPTPPATRPSGGSLDSLGGEKEPAGASNGRSR